MRAALLARNTALNLAGQSTGLVAAVLLIPLVLEGMGTERFGFLAVAWAALGYFAFLDLGLGRATTHFVAGALARADEEAVPALIWTAVLIQAALGLAGTLGLALLADPLARLLTARDPELFLEAAASLRMLAFAVPLVLVSGSFRGALEGAQRFGMINAIAVPSGILSLALPLIGVYLGFQLPGIVALLVAGRCATVVAFGLGCALTFHRFAARPRVLPAAFREMVGFGGWVMLSSITIPILVHLERFVIPYFLGVQALAYYAVPHEMALRLAVLPGALAVTLFPAFSFFAAGESRRLSELFVRPMRYLMVALAPVGIFLVVFGDVLLRVWIDAEFAAAGATVIRLFGLVFFVNGLAHIPFVALQGIGRPDLKVKLDAVQIPVYMLLLVLLVPRVGIAGAAAAKLLVTTVDLVGLTWLLRAANPAVVPAPRRLAGPAAAIVSLLAAALALRWLADGAVLAQALGFGALAALYAGLVWRRVVEPRDRAALSSLFGRAAVG